MARSTRRPAPLTMVAPDPAWAALLSESADPAFADAVLAAMDLARRARALPEDARVSWADLAEALGDPRAYEQLCRAHGRALAWLVRQHARAYR